eukprot:s242_g41.t1
MATSLTGRRNRAWLPGAAVLGTACVACLHAGSAFVGQPPMPRATPPTVRFAGDNLFERFARVAKANVNKSFLRRSPWPKTFLPLTKIEARTGGTMSFTELLGSTVLGKGCVEQNTAEALKGKKAVALYFSAHWCPPCRGFTPKLAEWYEKETLLGAGFLGVMPFLVDRFCSAEDLKAKGLEVVFVTGDRDEDQFKEYFNEQPWLAVDFNAKDLLQRIFWVWRTFKVQGIPSLIILDADGKLITKDGREAVSKDPTGEDMPWIPPKAKDLVGKMKLTGPAGTMTLTEAMAGKQALALYFSAHWCPPCRGFTPQLAEWYMKDLEWGLGGMESDLKAKGLEVVFVSSDRDEAAFKEYFGEMPWLALDFSDRKLKEWP